jgi:hypothetical protein
MAADSAMPNRLHDPVRAVLLVIAYLVSVVVRIENERHALMIRMCRDAKSGFIDSPCLAKTETRTSWVWHLYYALKD